MRKECVAALLGAVLWMPDVLCTDMAHAAVLVQDSITQQRAIGLDELYQLAEENSQSIKTYKTAIESARQSVDIAKTQRLPDLGVSLSIGYLGDGLLSDRDFSNWKHIDNPHFMNNFALKASQVVYSGGAITSGIELADLGRQMAELDWQKNRQEIRFLITGYYLDLCKLRNQEKVIDKNIELTDQVIKNMEARRKEGTALKNDITRYELQRESLKLHKTKVIDAQRIMNHQIVTTLHLPAETIINPDLDINNNEATISSEAEWQQLASGNNVGIKQAELAIKMNEQKVKLEHSELMPKVAVIAEDHFDGPITIEVPVLNNNFNYWFAGVGVSYNISSLFKSNKKLQKAKIDLRQSREQHVLAQEGVNNAIQAAYTDYQTSFTELATQKKSVELADQSYAVTANRYKNGLALLTDMLDASNMKLSADINLVNANINILYNYYRLKYITHTL